MNRAKVTYPPRPDIPVLHVYGQSCEHDSLIVVGNRSGLLALRAAVDAVLACPLDATGQAIAKGPRGGPTARDGEHYDVVVWWDETDWQGERWQGRSFPYYETEHLDCDPPELPAYPIDQPNAKG